MGLDDGSIGGHGGVDVLLGEFKELFRLTVVDFVEEDSSESTCLVSVRDHEIAVRPRLELGVELFIVVVALASMEVLHVVLIDVGGGDLGASAEPPDTATHLKVSVVEVHRGTKGVAGVHDA